MTTRLALLLLLAAAACSQKRIPGTDIKETRDTRAIYAVIDDYVQAMNKRDATGVLTQVAPDYFDDAGTPEPGDDLDRDALEDAVAADLANVEATKLGLTIRKIEVQEDGTAFAEVFYDSYYRVQTPTGPVPRRDTDVHRIRLKKVNGQWKITAGL